MISELLKAFIMIFVAEMGDKTQVLAMAFATKYKVKQVIIGIFFGSLFNHALAVFLGSKLSLIIPLNTLSIIAGFSFIFFALWSLKVDSDEEQEKKNKYGPILTVALAFFIGELGDKTQLTAIMLSSDAQYPTFILIGTVTGMVFTGILGIYLGIKLGSKIEEFYIKLGASAIFLIFGYAKLIESLSDEYLTGIYVTSFTLIVFSIAYLLISKALRQRSFEKQSNFKKVAEHLHDYYLKIQPEFEDICLGEDFCGVCDKENCLIGHAKSILLAARKEEILNINNEYTKRNVKDFNQDKVFDSLVSILEELRDSWANNAYRPLHKIRHNLEIILYNKPINTKTFSEYLIVINNLDKKLYRKISEK